MERFRPTLRRLAGGIRRKSRVRAHSAYYWLQRRRPIDRDLAAFGAYWFRGCLCNPRAIHETARLLAPDVRCVWIVQPENVEKLPPRTDYVIAGSLAYYRLIARAGAFVNNVNFPNHLIKRPGTRHLMTHHGTPLKLMGHDLEGRPVEDGRIDFAALDERSARWDFAISSNAYSTPILERAYPGTYETLEIGYPRNDVLVQATPDDVARIRAELGARPEQHILLYAPTHRDDDDASHLDLPGLAAAIGNDWLILSRPHHRYVPGGRPSSPGHGLVLDVSGAPSVEALCLAADVLVTDYSSIMFDYAILGRPIVCHVPDWESYRISRGVYFDLLAAPPGLVTRTDRQLAEALRTGAHVERSAREALAVFRERFSSSERGTASLEASRRLFPGRVGAVPANPRIVESYHARDQTMPDPTPRVDGRTADADGRSAHSG